MNPDKDNASANAERIKPTGSTLGIVLLVWSLRISIGGLFVISGLSKSIDLWGFVYKIEEYIGIWGLPWWRSLSFISAMGLSALEFVSGAMLITGAFRKSVVWWLLAIMCAMLPLTIYIYIADPVSDCGCFGEFIKLSNGATLIKNILITAALIVLVRNNMRAGTLFSPYIQWIPLVICTAYIVGIGFIGYNIQPLIDFRGFPAGERLLTDDGQDEDSIEVLKMIYERDGDRRIFTLDSLPDSTWTFVETITREQENTTINDVTQFVVIKDGEDIAPEIIRQTGEQLLIVIPEIDRADVSVTPELNEISETIESRGGTVCALVSGDEKGLEYWRDISLGSYPIYSAEPTMLKELSRGTISLVHLTGGIIDWKRTASSLSLDSTTDGTPTGIVEAVTNHGSRLLVMITIATVILLALIGLPGWIAQIVRHVRHFLRRK